MLGTGPAGMTLVGLIYDEGKHGTEHRVMITHEVMRPIVVSLDMIEVSRRRESLVLPKQLLHPSKNTESYARDREWQEYVRMNSGIPITNSPKVAFEVSSIDRIEPNLTLSINGEPHSVWELRTAVT